MTIITDEMMKNGYKLDWRKGSVYVYNRSRDNRQQQCVCPICGQSAQEQEDGLWYEHAYEWDGKTKITTEACHLPEEDKIRQELAIIEKASDEDMSFKKLMRSNDFSREALLIAEKREYYETYRFYQPVW